jgi:hypothetical protein
MAKIAGSNISPLIDDYGLLMAQIAEIKRRAQPLKEQIEELGAGAYEGNIYRVTVSKFKRENLDKKAVKKKLSRQFIRAHTTYTPVTMVRISGPNADGIKIEED